jgi:Phage tail sheath C-terminal domain
LRELPAIRGFHLNILNKKISFIEEILMVSLISPGVAVTVTDESVYASTNQGTIPLIIMATASDKASPTAGAGNAPFTSAAQAGKLYLATSQRDLIQNFGNPKFYAHGGELNEYGLWAAYSYLGIANQCYVLRADIDLGQLLPQTTPPIANPLGGTYWFDLGQTTFGVFKANGNTSPGAAWTQVTVLVALTANVDSNGPLSAFGSNGNVCIAPTMLTTDASTGTNYFYEKLAGTWYQIGSTAWAAQHDTIITGTATAPVGLVAGNTFLLNGTTITLPATPTVANIITTINPLNIGGAGIIVASAVSGALVITNTAGGNITLAAGTGNPLTSLGLTVGTTSGVSITRTSVSSLVNGVTIPNVNFPSGSTAGSFWVKGNPANNGAVWVIKYYNSAIAAFTVLTAPFYAFDSTKTDGDVTKDAAALSAMPSTSVGNVYVGYDTTTGDQQIRRWSGSQWQHLVYEADFTGPQQPPVAGTLWYNTNFYADIMYNNGVNWVGYRHQFGSTNAKGVQIAGSPPTTQNDTNSSPLQPGDLWIDSTDLENYPAIYRWNSTNLSWGSPIDNTDQTTPFGITFGDARANSGPTFTGITNIGGSVYTFNSTLPADLALSDYVDPDAPDARTFPAGTLLFNMRASTYNIKTWQPGYFKSGGWSATDNTTQTYTWGNFTFPAVDASLVANARGGRWVSALGNNLNGSPYMGRKAQRGLVVQALGAAVTANQEIRSEIVFFNLMAAPGYPEMMFDLHLLNIDMKQIAFCVGDTPSRLASDGSSIIAWASNQNNAGITGEDGLLLGDDYTGVYYPWGLGTNIDGSEIMIPPSAIALVTIAYNDQVAYPWYAPAGFTRGLVSNATSVGYLDSGNEYVSVILNQGQRDVMYSHKINPIAYIPNRGLVVYGQKTLDPNSTALDRVNVARLVNYIAYNVDNILKPFIFEPNTHTTRATARIVVERFFAGLVGLNGLYDFAVVCDASNNTPDRIDRNELWVDCAIQPTKTVEFIYVPIRVLATQAVV